MALISTLSEGRRIQHSLITAVLAKVYNQNPHSQEKLILCIFKQITSKLDVYARAFCYRVLVMLWATSAIPEVLVEIDKYSDILDVNIAAMSFLAHHYANYARYEHFLDLMRTYIHNPHFEVRAVAARLIGELGDEKEIPLLKEALHDAAWWVRVNSALALSKLGPSGMAILQAQAPDKDKFAYETAQKVLINLNQEMK